MTEQEYKEICAEVQNSGIPVPSQQKIIDACGKQVGKKVLVKHSAVNLEEKEFYGEDVFFAECPNCKELLCSLWNDKNCGVCGQKLDWRGEE